MRIARTAAAAEARHGGAPAAAGHTASSRAETANQAVQRQRHGRASPLAAPEPPRGTLPGGVSNQWVQAHWRAQYVHAKLEVGAVNDPAEAEADRMAEAAMGGAAPCACGGTCDACRGATKLRRKPAIDKAPSALRTDLFSGSLGRSLDAATIGFFAQRFGADFSGVRVHDDPIAAATARRIGARAFAVGNDIGFAHGQFAPATQAGRQLLAHELAHVAQGGTAIRRQANPETEPQDRPAQSEMGQSPAGATAPPLLDPTRPVDERVEVFKTLVTTTAVRRLIANQRNLDAWATAVRNAVPSGDIAALGLLQGGGTRPYFELQDIRDPGLRELRAYQAFGHFRACTGCHIENQLWGSRQERLAQSPMPWMTPNELRAAAAGPPPAPGTIIPLAAQSPFQTSGYQPSPGSEEARLYQLLPDPRQTAAALGRVRAILEALGPGGYRVLPGELMGELETQSPEVVRAEILDAIAQRQSDYGELIDKIDAGDLGYEHFGPVIQSLLPLADPDVRDRITEEMDSRHFWETVEAAVVGALTIAALLLTIFPPTSALGVAGLASLEAGLATYGLVKGEEMVRVGSAYSLAQGASDVLSPAQQDAGSMMVLGGFVSILTAPLGFASAMGRARSLAGELPSVSTALVTAGGEAVARTVQQGDFLITVAEDGSMYVTSASRPDLMIMVRGDTATLYQAMEGGAMRVVGSATVPARAAPPPSPLMLGPGAETGPMSGAMVPLGPQAMVAGAAPAGPALSEFGVGGPGRPLLPPTAEPPMLGPGRPTTYTWEQISRMRQPRLWQERQAYMQELYGVPGERYYRVPGTGGRYVDVPAPELAGEVKSYTRWITVEGQAQRNVVRLTPRLQQQIDADVWLRDNVPGYDPRWMFTDAPPDAGLRQALYDAGIVFVIYH